MSTSLTAIDNVQVFEREPESSCKLFDETPEFTLRKRCKLVEERLDWLEISGFRISIVREPY